MTLQNVELVQNFCTIWEAADYTAEMMVPYLAENCAVRLMHTLPFAHSPAAVLEQARMLMPRGDERMRVKHLSTSFVGPMVMAHRIDTLVIPGQPESDWEMLGVFLIEDAKIKEWTDYMLTPFTQAQDGTVNV